MPLWLELELRVIACSKVADCECGWYSFTSVSSISAFCAAAGHDSATLFRKSTHSLALVTAPSLIFVPWCRTAESRWVVPAVNAILNSVGGV